MLRLDRRCLGRLGRVRRPDLDAYWDAYNPTNEQYAKLDLPILTITGMYDDAQPGALDHYRRHMAQASPAAHAKCTRLGVWLQIVSLVVHRITIAMTHGICRSPRSSRKAISAPRSMTPRFIWRSFFPISPSSSMCLRRSSRIKN